MASSSASPAAAVAHAPPKARMSARLTASSYQSPYSRPGAPARPHPNTDAYAPLRATAIATLEAMGFDPPTMTEHAILWADHQDPYSHVTNSQFLVMIGPLLRRLPESFDEFLSKEEADGVLDGKTVIPALVKCDLSIVRQVKYPDVLIGALRHEPMDASRLQATFVLFSLKQQAIVAQCLGVAPFINVKTGRSVDIRSLGGNFGALYDGINRRAERARLLHQEWKEKNAKPARRGSKL